MVVELGRLVRWIGYVNRPSFNRILSKFEKLLMADAHAPIGLWLFTNGGETDVGIAFYDAMQVLKPNLITIGNGEVSSIAPVILSAGQTRILTRNTTLFFHNVAVESIDRGIKLSPNLLRTVAWEVDNAIATYRKILVKRSGGLLSQKKLRELMDNEITLTANEAVALGLADAVADPNMFKTK